MRAVKGQEIFAEMIKLFKKQGGVQSFSSHTRCPEKGKTLLYDSRLHSSPSYCKYFHTHRRKREGEELGIIYSCMKQREIFA